MFSLVLLCGQALADVTQVAISEATPGEHFRRYGTTTAWTDGYGVERLLTASGVRIDAESTSASEGSVDVDVTAFYINTLFSAAIKLGYFNAEADWERTSPGAAANADSQQNAKADVDLSLSSLETWFRAYFLLEYNEENDVDGFQLGEDKITGWYKLNFFTLPWKPFVISETTLTNEAGEEFNAVEIEAQTKDEVFLLRLTITGHTSEVGSLKITPDMAKMDFEIRWFDNPLYQRRQPAQGEAFKGPGQGYNKDTDSFCVPTLSAACWRYASGPSPAGTYPDARVAMVSGFAGKAASAQFSTEAEVGKTETDPSVEVSSNGNRAFFTWKNTIDHGDSNTQATSVGAVFDGEAELNANWKANLDSELEAYNQFVDDDKQVQASVDVQGGWVAKVIVFSFDASRPKFLLWDPIMGVDASDSGVAQMVPSFALIAGLCALLRFHL